MHALDLGAGQLLVRLDIETAIAPQGAGVLVHHQGGVLAGKAGEPGQGIVIVRQVLTAMGITGHQQHTVGPGCFGSGAQCGDFFVGSQNGSLLFINVG